MCIILELCFPPEFVLCEYFCHICQSEPTLVTPIRRPIPCPAQAQSQFVALPNVDHGFTVER